MLTETEHNIAEAFISNSPLVTKVDYESIASLIPEHFLNELIQISGDLKSAYWRAGDIANMVYVQAVADKKNVTRADVFYKVGKVLGKSARSVRVYAMTAAFYSYETRLEYDVLPFSHFTFAMQFHGIDGVSGNAMWRAVLNCSLDTMEKWGSPISVEGLGRMYRDGFEKEAPKPTKSTELPVQKSEAPTMDDVKNIITRFRVDLSMWSGQLTEIYLRLGGQGGLKVMRALSLLIEAINELEVHDDQED
jgi:hypothetical protein